MKNAAAAGAAMCFSVSRPKRSQLTDRRSVRARSRTLGPKRLCSFSSSSTALMSAAFASSYPSNCHVFTYTVAIELH